MEKVFKLYSLPNCPMCKILKEVLKSKKIDFELIEDENILRKNNITEVPVLSINGKMHDFNNSMYIVNGGK